MGSPMGLGRKKPAWMETPPVCGKPKKNLGKCMNVCHEEKVGSKLPAPTLQWMKENSNVDIDYKAALAPSN